MKIFLIIMGIIFLGFIALQAYTVMAADTTEVQKYDVIHQEKEFEIRYYPSATIATVQSDAHTYKELAGPGFRTLAGYIFGGNATGQKIPMTAPVLMQINDSLSSMSFVMPEGYANDLPEPNNPGIHISKTNPEYVAVIRFGGFVNDHDLKEQAEKLQKLLKENGIEICGNFRFLGYNPPYQLIGRRNEVIVPVVWK